MASSFVVHALASLALLIHGALAETFNPLQFVDPLIGSQDGGNVFPGASLPYGMAKAVADSANESNQGGFVLDGSGLYGFSMMHDSGTGGRPSLGTFPLFVYPSCPGGEINNCDFPKKTRTRHAEYEISTVFARPGHFVLQLHNGIQVDMTTAHHGALFRFRLPSRNEGKPLILQDLSDLSDSRQDNASITISPSTGRITGTSTFLPSFGVGNYTLHVCTDFHSGSDTHPLEIADTGIFVNSRANNTIYNLTISRGINGYPLPGGAFIRFAPNTHTVLTRVATSFISIEQACAHAESEIPTFNFTALTFAATAAWRAKLNPIHVSTVGVSKSLLTNFYSGIYRTLMSPQNYTGENPLWQSKEPYFDSFYCIWDLWRTQLPFLTILDPGAVAEMVRSLIDTYRHVGWLPDCRMSLCKGLTQGGSNADNVLADAYLKGIKDGIDWETGYEAVVKDAEVEPFDWSVEGRGGLDSWMGVGYVPVEDFDYKGFGTMTRSVSRTLEYSYNDFCVGQMAGRMGREMDKERYLERSGNWRNLWRRSQESDWLNTTRSTGFKGFFQGRYLNGTWAHQDPLTCSNLDSSYPSCSLQNTAGETFESSLWEYSFFVPHDMASLITHMGGPHPFIHRLNTLHDKGITYIGNEPSFLTVFQYHYAGAPALSTRRARSYIPSSFAPRPDGLPGNDDSGTMGAFVAFAMMGLFPVPGQDVYLITVPFFEEVRVRVGEGEAVVRCEGFEGAWDGGEGLYVQRAWLDGVEWGRNWVGHELFGEGRELVLVLGREANSTWGTRVEDLPPSLGEYRGFGEGVNGTVGGRFEGPRREGVGLGRAVM